MLKGAAALPFHCLLSVFLLVFENNENTEHALKVVEDKCVVISGKNSADLISSQLETAKTSSDRLQR